MNGKVIGQRLLQLRGERKREKVAADVGISVSALTMYETGKRIPRDEIKVELARYYGESVQSLFFDTDVHEMCTAWASVWKQ